MWQGYIGIDEQTGNVIQVDYSGVEVYKLPLSLKFQDRKFIGDWVYDMPLLIAGDQMFNNCYNLTSFSGDLSSLKSASSMFQNCSNLTSFSGDLSSLRDGGYMFNSCYNLTSFSGDLSSLTNGTYMFAGTKLNKESVMGIINSLIYQNASMQDGMILTLGIDMGLIEDSHLLELFGVDKFSNSGYTETIIKNKVGANWTVKTMFYR